MRVVVVGAGVGGLAAAARLAAAGHRVTVCEQAPAVGGKLGRVRLAGATFDTGPSLLTMPHVLAETFADTGDPLDRVLDLQPVEPIAEYRYADGTRFATSADPATTAANLDGALACGSGADWLALMRRAGRIWRAVRGPVLERALDGPTDLAPLALRVRDLAAVAPHATLRGLGRRYLRDPRLRMLLDRYATYTGSDPRRAPAALAVVPYVEQTFGAWYVTGGLYRIAEALADRAAGRGARLRLATPVTGIEVAGGRATAVRLADGERLAADAVVANADAAHVYGDLVRSPLANPARRRLARATPSLSGFVVLLVLRGRTAGLGHHTVLFPADYDAEFAALFGSRPRPVADPTLYVAAPRDPAVAPAGGEGLLVLANAPRSDEVDWDAPGTAEAYADRLVDLLAARGLDVRGRVVARRAFTPADLARRTGAVGGAIYGTSSNGPRAAFLRPANRSPVPGLFLVGGSSHPGGGLPLVLLSARIVAGLVGRP
ncbi:MAG TPA: phytoene desaturase family protein [Egibacteraceae bacterium]|nr:phytoene desaturase family protein [Egibacteraceae bacterium]